MKWPILNSFTSLILDNSIIDSKVEEISTNFCSNLGINLDSKTGLIDWKPGFDQAGVYEIKVKAESPVTNSSHIFSDVKLKFQFRITGECTICVNSVQKKRKETQKKRRLHKNKT